MCAVAIAGPCADEGGETASSPVGEKGRWSLFSCWSMITSTKETEGVNALVFFVGGGGMVQLISVWFFDSWVSSLSPAIPLFFVSIWRVLHRPRTGQLV